MKTWAQSPEDFAQELGKWFETYGFAVVADHGVDQLIIDNVLEKSKTFFALPEEVK